jgi:hypothetical protein
VIPSGSHLPESFLAQDWNAAGGIARPLSECQVHREARCEALLVDLDGDGVNEIVLFGRQPSSPQVFAERSGAWEVIGTLQTQSGCPSVREALREGKFDSVPAAWRDIMVGGVRIAVMPKGSSCTK